MLLRNVRTLSRRLLEMCLAVLSVLSFSETALAACTPPAVYCYPGFTYPAPPLAHPYISLQHYTSVNHSSSPTSPYQRFKAMADRAVAGSPR